MAIRLAAPVADFDRMAQLLERLRVTDPRAERWNAAFDELRAIVMAQRDENDNVVPIDALTTAA